MTVADLPTWLHGGTGLAVSYGALLAPMLAGLTHGKARWNQWLAAPALAVPLTLGASVATAAMGPVFDGVGIGSNTLLQMGISAAANAWLGYASGRAMARRREPPAARHQRGTLLADGRASGVKRSQSSGITLAGVEVREADETKHFKLIGTTGTGKSTAIKELLDGALKRGDRAVIADPDGGYLDRYYDPRRGDAILNPFDARARKWDLFGEIHSAYDVEHLARSLIPDGDGHDRSWSNYARTFFVAVTRQAHAAGIKDVGELYRLLVAADARELRTLVEGTAAQPFLEEHNSRMFDSIRSIASSAVGALEYTAQQQTALFSVRDWIAKQNPEHRSAVLFIPYQAGQIAALRSTVSAWMRLAIFSLMDQKEADHRLWFVIDELDALGSIDGLKDALARVRKFGGRTVLGFQTIGQVATTYGAGDAQTIVENCGNSLILRCSASQHGGTASFASKLIGQREVIRSTESHSQRITDWFASTTRSEHIGLELAVLDSQIEQLPDREGYLKLSSSPQWLRVSLPLVPQVNRPSTAVSAAVATHITSTAQASAAAREAWLAQRAAACSATAPVAAPTAARTVAADRPARGRRDSHGR